MVDGCGCSAVEPETPQQRRVLTIALALNAAMFVVGIAAGLLGRSSGLLADAFDMLADALAYGIALAAIDRGPGFKARAGRLSGIMLLLVGIGVLADVGHRALVGSGPIGWVMMATAALSLAVNASVLRMLGRYRHGEAHMRATWIFTRADVIANLAVIASGLLVLATGARWLDLVVGAGIGLYICKEAVEILRESAKAPDNGTVETSRG